jgi:hypothetical protein
MPSHEATFYPGLARNMWPRPRRPVTAVARMAWGCTKPAPYQVAVPEVFPFSQPVGRHIKVAASLPCSKAHLPRAVRGEY